MRWPRWYALVLLAIILAVGLHVADPTAQTLIQGLVAGCPSGECAEHATWQSCDSTGKWYRCAHVTDGVGIWEDAAAGSFAPVGANYVVQLDDPVLTGDQNLSILSTGLMKVTTSTGAVTTAVAGTDYVIPGGNTATATALAANGANCSAGSFPLGVTAAGAVESCTAVSSSLAGTATALAANGANCSAGQAPRGVDTSGAAENCTAYLAAIPSDTGSHHWGFQAWSDGTDAASDTGTELCALEQAGGACATVYSDTVVATVHVLAVSTCGATQTGAYEAFCY